MTGYASRANSCGVLIPDRIAAGQMRLGKGCARHLPDCAINVGRRPPTKRQPATGQGKTIYHILSKNSAMCPPSRAVVPLPPFHLDVARRRAPRHRQTFLQGRLPSRNPRSLGHGPIEGPQERPDRRKHVGRLRWSSGIISHILAKVLADGSEFERHRC